MTFVNELKIINDARTNVADVNDNKRLVVSLDELAAALSSNAGTQLNITAFTAGGVEYNVSAAGNLGISLEALAAGISANAGAQLKITPYASGGVEHKVNPQTGAIATIDYEHHEIHAGSHFFVSGYIDLAGSHVLDMTFLTPDTTKWIHWNWKIDVESETNWYVYEGAVETAALANSITPLNNDRNSLTASGVVLKYEDQADLAAANADTDVTTATLIESGIAGAHKSAGDDIRSHELILKQNTLYCLRAVATVAGYIDFTMHWYEHTNYTITAAPTTLAPTTLAPTTAAPTTVSSTTLAPTTL